MIKIEQIDEFQGSISIQEADMLARYAKLAEGEAIVEVGSWRGKSAVAMAIGVQQQSCELKSTVYCIEPHENFKGVYGGNFGPKDRKHFYEAMLKAECSEFVALINLSSTQVAQSWTKQLGFVFIDGDHTEQGVRSDASAWLEKLQVGGIVAFDDAIDESIGPFKIVAELESSGAFQRVDEVGKIVVLRKLV